MSLLFPAADLALRRCLNMVLTPAHTWYVLVADDFQLESAGIGCRSALLIFFVLCAACNFPHAWNNTTVGWFRALAPSLQTRDHLLAREMDSRNLSTFEEGLGRVMYVAGALEYERHVLAPLLPLHGTPPAQLRPPCPCLCVVHAVLPFAPSVSVSSVICGTRHNSPS